MAVQNLMFLGHSLKQVNFWTCLKFPHCSCNWYMAYRSLCVFYYFCCCCYGLLLLFWLFKVYIINGKLTRAIHKHISDTMEVQSTERIDSAWFCMNMHVHYLLVALKYAHVCVINVHNYTLEVKY